MSKRRSLGGLLLFVAVVLAVPAGLSHLLPRKEPFDAKPIAQLRAMQPDIIMLGDSVLNSGVEPKLLGTLLGGRRVELLWYGSSTSASWYFRLKNQVVASGVRPQLVCVFFRDQMLTDPAFRTSDSYRYKLESAMHAREPVYDLVLGNESSTEITERWVNAVYPLNAWRHGQHERIKLMTMRALADFGTGVGRLQRSWNDTFAIENLRAGAEEEAVSLSRRPEHAFDPDPRRSFLPHIVEVAAKAGLQLCFVRTRRFPGANNQVVQSEQMRRYAADLSAWLEGHGCYFIDDTDTVERTADMYIFAGDDHLGAWAKQRSTEMYAEKLRPLLSR